MNEGSLEKWTETLIQLRQARRDSIQEMVQKSGSAFKPADFYAASEESLIGILEKWMEVEQKTFENLTTASLNKTLNTAQAEMTSLIDFEMEAIDRDMESYAETLQWDETTVNDARTKFEADLADIRKRYDIKINAYKDTAKKVSTETIAVPPPTAYGGHSSGGGSGVLMMFMVGLLLGAGPSVYFWDASKKAESKYLDERTRMRADQKRMEDGLAVLQENYENLAQGKIKNLPDIEKEIARLKSEFREERSEIEQDYRQDKERILKKTPAGDKQDKALERITDKREADLKTLEEKEKSAIEALERDREVLKALIVR